MRLRNAFYVALSLVLRISTTAAAPPLTQPFSAAPISSSLNLVRPLSDGTNIPSFQPGPPKSPVIYDLAGSDLSLEVNALGKIPGRDESVVKEVVNRAFSASIDPYRPQVAMSEDGYHVHEKGFLLGVTPSKQLPGEERLTWGMWTDILSSIHGYVEAYPGFDFTFEIWLTPPVGSSGGYVIGAGLGITRS